MKPLFLILKKKYFDQIKSGQKTEELRAQTDYWAKRLVEREYSHIIFQLGYSKNAERMSVEYLGLEKRVITHEFFGPDPINVFVLKLGNIINGTLHTRQSLQTA